MIGGLVPAALAVGAVLLLALGVRPSPTPRRVATPRSRARRALRPRARRTARRRSRRGAGGDADALIGLLDDVGRTLRTGGSLSIAVEQARQRHPTALDNPRPAGRPTDPDTSLVLHALAVTARTGGPAVPGLERAAAVLRERRSWRAERRAHAAQARLGASVMTVLPIGFALWSAAGSERVRAVYAASPIAVVLAVAGAGLNAIGWWWMRRLTDGDAP